MRAPNLAADSSELSRFVVQTAVSSNSGLASSAGRWDRWAHPTLMLAPITPKRIFSDAIAIPPKLPGPAAPILSRDLPKGHRR